MKRFNPYQKTLATLLASLSLGATALVFAQQPSAMAEQNRSQPQPTAAASNDAQHGRGRHAHDAENHRQSRHRQHRHRGQDKPMMAATFAQFDANNDARISRAEFMQEHQRLFAQHQAQRQTQQQTQRSEQAAAQQQQRPPRQPMTQEQRNERINERFSRLDSNNDGVLTQAEFDARRPQRPAPAASAPQSNPRN